MLSFGDVVLLVVVFDCWNLNIIIEFLVDLCLSTMTIINNDSSYNEDNVDYDDDDDDDDGDEIILILLRSSHLDQMPIICKKMAPLSLSLFLSLPFLRIFND
ncbi:hypothetical protein SSS_10016 [Sarcoptes scabiei]|nr:hypothetical protein SSS_10016 [Sarcoptes scabiei]